MSLATYVTLPTAGDGVDASGTPRGARFAYAEYLVAVARAAQATRFTGVVLPDHPDADDPWGLAPAIARAVPRLDIVAEQAPGAQSPVYTAKVALSFQRMLGERLAWQLDLRAPGAFERAEEYLTVLDGLWTDAPAFAFEGRFAEVTAGGFFAQNVRYRMTGHRLEPRRRPLIVTSGDDAATIAFAARRADRHVFGARPAGELATAVSALREQARVHERIVGAAVALHVVARESSSEARREAERNGVQSGSLVGSYADVAAALRGYEGAGVEAVFLTASPALEAAYELGQYVLPLVEASLAVTGRGRG